MLDHSPASNELAYSLPYSYPIHERTKGIVQKPSAKHNCVQADREIKKARTRTRRINRARAGSRFL